MANIIIDPQHEPFDEGERSLRPKELAEIIGRKKEVESLKVMIDAAQARNDTLDHLLFSGPPGVGKTSFALIISNEMGVPLVSTSGPAIERQADLASILNNIDSGGVLFIDEIHRLHKSIEEILYPAMEDRSLDIVIGKGPSAKTLKIDLPPFTVVGATTRVGFLSAPLRDRFGAHYQLDFFSTEELAQIVLQKAHILDVTVSAQGAEEIAKRSRGTARISVRLLKRVRDYIQTRSQEIITPKSVSDALTMYDIDKYGLTNTDRKILKIIVDDYHGGPVGISTLAAALSEEKVTIEEYHEPYLIQAGFVHKTARGRMATKKTIEYMQDFITEEQ